MGRFLTADAKLFLHRAFCTACGVVFIALVLLPWATGFDSAQAFWGWP